jgi:shikimate kinase
LKNIILTGFMGTGKTAVGKELSRLLDMKLTDLDCEIVKEEKMSINEIFKQLGEQKFREIETEILRKVCRNKNVIISTGGGVVLKQENIDMMRKNGILICLTAKPETILERTSHNSDRPLLQVENPFEKIRELLNFRKPFYEKADMIVDTENKTPLRVAEEIIETIKNKG